MVDILGPDLANSSDDFTVVFLCANYRNLFICDPLQGKQFWEGTEPRQEKTITFRAR
jgi:hypothetical protein